MLRRRRQDARGTKTRYRLPTLVVTVHRPYFRILYKSIVRVLYNIADLDRSHSVSFKYAAAAAAASAAARALSQLPIEETPPRTTFVAG